MKKLLLISMLFLTGCQTKSFDIAPAPERYAQTIQEEVQPRKLDVVHPDQFLGTTAPAGLDARPFQEELSNIAKAESKRIVQERIAEEKRLAEEQRIKEENERLAAEVAVKEAEAALAAEQAVKEEQQAAEAKQKAVNSEPVAANTQQESKSASPAPQSAPPAPEPAQTRTDGFNFRGHHFPLSSFSGSGQVPKETPYVFVWNELPSHYLIEQVSPAGRVIQQVQMGDKIVVNGNTYTVHHIKRGVVNDDTAWDVLTGTPASITFQTCEYGKGWNGLSLLTIWYAS